MPQTKQCYRQDKAFTIVKPLKVIWLKQKKTWKKRKKVFWCEENEKQSEKIPKWISLI